MTKGFFITATDTDVGKTVIAAAVVRALGFFGHRAGAMKPVETGCVREGEMLVPADGLFLKEIANMDENVSIITPCMYETPLSPYDAGEVEGKMPDLDAVFRAYRDLGRKYDGLVVEGAGGLYVPILRDYFMADLAREMQLPLIIVARPYLGTINHTLLTIHYARSQGIEVAGIVLNYTAPPGETLAEERNPKTLTLLTDVPVIGVFPYLPVVEVEAIDKAVDKSFDLGILKRSMERS